MSYLSLSGETVTENVIEKSRFIATSRHVEGEEQAKAFIDEIRKKYPDATHNCYAYIADDKGNFLRFSDDGEPQGTAGMPMLEVVKNNNLRQVAVVVTRYFGGIKLGAGGLVRAYSGAVAQNLNSAKKVSYRQCVKSDYTVAYTEADSAQRFFAANECNVEGVNYSDCVIFNVAVKKELLNDFNNSLINRLNGKIKIDNGKEFLYPFPLDI